MSFENDRDESCDKNAKLKWVVGQQAVYKNGYKDGSSWAKKYMEVELEKQKEFRLAMVKVLDDNTETIAKQEAMLSEVYNTLIGLKYIYDIDLIRDTLSKLDELRGVK